MADFEMHSDVDSDASESVVDSDVSDSETSNSRSPLQPYEYNPLNLSFKEIRLLRIEKIPIPEGTIAIFLTIRHVQLDDTAEPFTALSYVWGNEAPTHTVDILDDNLEPHTIEVRDNLWKFLVNARLSDEDWSRAWFWIDQICIQQKCHQERCHQVEMMGEIYSAAVSTLVWPGFVPAYNDDGHTWNNTFFNAEELEIIQNSWPMNDDGTTRDLGWGLDRPKMTCSTMRFLGELTMGLLGRVMVSPYWTRLWVIQEVVLARRVDVLLADKMWGLSEIASAMSAIGEHPDIVKAAWNRIEHPESFKAALEQNEQAHIGSDIMH